MRTVAGGVVICTIRVVIGEIMLTGRRVWRKIGCRLGGKRVVASVRTLLRAMRAAAARVKMRTRVVLVGCWGIIIWRSVVHRGRRVRPPRAWIRSVGSSILRMRGRLRSKRAWKGCMRPTAGGATTTVDDFEHEPIARVVRGRKQVDRPHYIYVV